MYIKSPYDTSALSIYDVKRYSEPLISCLLGDRNYEIHDVGETRIIAITGFDEKEQDVPMFDHPVMLEDVRKGKVVAVDLRKSLKKIDSQPVYLKDSLKNATAGRAIINYGLIYAFIENGDIGMFRNIKDSVVYAFYKIVSSIISGTVALNPLEQAAIESVCTVYCHRMFMVGESNDDIEMLLKNRLKNAFIGYKKMDRTAVNDLFEKINIHADNLEELVENLKVMLPTKEGAITSGSIATMASSIWYGPGGISLTLASFESIASLLTLVITASTEKMYERSKLGMLIMNSKKKIELSELSKVKRKLSEYADI